KNLVESGQLGIFTNGYWGHSAYKLPHEANLMAVAHYLEALSWQRDVVKLHTIFGGKNPHPSFLVGGVPCAISIDPQQQGAGATGATAVNMKGLQLVQSVIKRMQEFVDQVYVPDTLTIASFYKDWFKKGEGVGNFLTYGDFPATSMDDPASFLVPSGVILDRDLSKVHELDINDPSQIQEFVDHSWYKYSGGEGDGLHPYDGETDLNYTGPKPPYEHLDTDSQYSWMKSPRWRGKAMEVGPLARVLMLYAKGHEPTVELANMALKKLDLPIEAMFSTMGRTAARTLETKIFADSMQGWYDQLIANIKAGDLRTFNEAKWDPSTWPAKAKGVGFMEAPRGALGHWIVIEDGKIANYQAVVPSTWNAGPRDVDGNSGPYEAALKGHKLHDAKQPIEILRTIHSFDPCIACAVHVTDPDGEELIKVKVR
ncbi:MAG: hydrogenase 1 large subunit, partial [Gammaproteobacteria bacterium]|nr:hydrogenase 1 large subunit [Gammaproteobacteria bacterium]